MKEYLKMSDVFDEQVMPRNSTNGLTLTLHGNQAVHGSHAICVHDELVAEVERLRGIIERVISTSHELAERSPTTQWGDGYKECALATGHALEDLIGKGA